MQICAVATGAAVRSETVPEGAAQQPGAEYFTLAAESSDLLLEFLVHLFHGVRCNPGAGDNASDFIIIVHSYKVPETK